MQTSSNDQAGPLDAETLASYRLLQTGCGRLNIGNLEFLSVSGPDAASFLQGLLSQNVHGISIGASAPSWVLDANGKILFAVHILRVSERSFLLQTAGEVSDLHTHLDRYLVMEDAILASDGLRCISLQGRGTEAWLEAHRQQLAQTTTWQHDRFGLGGCDLVFKHEQETEIGAILDGAGLPHLRPAALEVARIEAFRPLFGKDMAAGVNPLIYGLGHWASSTKGCYVGQETIARTRDRGHPPRIAVLLATDETTPPNSVCALQHEGKPAGELTSAGWSPSRGNPLAIAILKFRLAEKGQKVNDIAGREWTVIEIGTYKA